MKSYALFIPVAAYLCLPASLLAAQPLPPAEHTPTASEKSPAMPAETCRSDLRAFAVRMEKDGYWQGVNPIGGYEVRDLVASADGLAEHGQQQPCEDSLAMTRAIYTLYLADMHRGQTADGARRAGEQ